MPGLRNYIPAVTAIILCLFFVPLIAACGNNGIVAPDGPQYDLVNPNPPADPNDRGDVTVDDGENKEDPGDDTLSPTMDIPTGSIDDLASALAFLRESGGGVLTSPLLENKLMIHIWDAATQNNLPGQAAVACEGGPISIVDIEGVGLFENVTFPVTVTVRVNDYPLKTYTGTSGNILSFPLEMLPGEQPAHIFGIAETRGCSSMAVFGDSLIPDVTYLTPATMNSEYFQYRQEVPAGQKLGFSAFLIGSYMIDGDDGGVPEPVPLDGLFWMTNCFVWNLGPLNPGDEMFYTIPWEQTIGPDDVALGVASVPEELYTSNGDSLELRKIVLPVTAFLEAERYFVVGPQVDLRDDDPAAIDYACPWFEPPEWGDRILIAGFIETPDGAIDLVHAEWDTGINGPDIIFSGIPQAGVIGHVTEIGTMPYIGINDPLGINSDLVRIHVSAYGFRPLWDIVVAGGVATVDTSEFGVPLAWLLDKYGNHEILYRIECLDALGLGIDDFNEDQINATRLETCFSEWVEPQE